MSWRVNLVLTIALVLCALSVVNAQYQARSLFIELERAQAVVKNLDIEWAQLQLDQSTLAKHARIEANARRYLNMVAVTPERTQYLTAGPVYSPLPLAGEGVGERVIVKEKVLTSTLSPTLSRLRERELETASRVGGEN